MAIAVITGTTVAGYLMVRTDQGGQVGAAFAAAALPGTRAMAVLAQRREQMIVMDTASHTMHRVGAPKLASRVSTSSGSTSSGTSGGGGGLPSGPPPNPGTAQSIAYNMLSSFGFSKSQWTCLDDLWQQESGWNYQAENASGAYGIPQALPGSKMASAGADWQTNPATQIKWGLGYIKSLYGTPCGAWAHEEADGYY
jgi:hypothetical protein